MIYLRKALPKDCWQIWYWRNEETARMNSLNTDPIPYEEHKIWYKKVLQNPEICILIVIDSDMWPVGYVRMGYGKINICVDKDHRKNGHATEAIELVSWKRCLTAEIKCDNVASIKAFKNAGYEDAVPKTQNGSTWQKRICQI